MLHMDSKDLVIAQAWQYCVDSSWYKSITWDLRFQRLRLDCSCFRIIANCLFSEPPPFGLCQGWDYADHDRHGRVHTEGERCQLELSFIWLGTCKKTSWNGFSGWTLQGCRSYLCNFICLYCSLRATQLWSSVVALQLRLITIRNIDRSCYFVLVEDATAKLWPPDFSRFSRWLCC